MEYKIKSGDYEIYKSGLVISFRDHPISFEFGDLKIEIHFKNNGEKPRIKREIDKTNNKKLKINLYNFNNVLGTNTTRPLHIGTFKGKKLFLNFDVDGDEDKTSQKTFQYTWYLG